MRPELRLKVPKAGIKQCDKCEDRFTCWTDECIVISAYKMELKRHTNGRFLTAYFNLKPCIPIEVLRDSIDAHNKVPVLFYAEYDLGLISSSLVTDFVEFNELKIEAQFM